MTEITSETHSNNISETQSNRQWADVFYGVLVAPKQTMDILADDDRYKSDQSAILFSLSTVILSSLIAGAAAAHGNFDFGGQVRIIFCLFSSLFCWAVLSGLLYLIARIVRSSHRNPSSAFIVSGWTFLPLFFVPPVLTFLSYPAIGWLLSFLLLAWILLLQCIAFSSVLNYSAKRMIALVVGVPVLYKLLFLAGLTLALSIYF
ncbi:MAG: YIP1 family protein [Leptolyngbya sp.]|nr:YIP1 family protein [Candidatus Melainabacteria bacterium]